ncbi:UNVERIFIED_CONTAM: SufE-like protein 1, chloroplastic/mitochondrial [Sesamum radiatum]|uniref:SufE-like protein 1, chloroplastic/mitochondrial n=1 Tax=Sesamum radiatum TaxID=300843 RepID=A0AAW2K2Y0_SESRA
MSISTKIPHSPLIRHSSTPFLKPTKIPSLSSPSHKFFFFKNITIQRISTKDPVFSATPSSSPAVSLQPLEELPPKLQEIIKLFQGVQEPKAKFGSERTWMMTKMIFEADSDSVLTKGLAALLVQGLSGRPVEEIVREKFLLKSNAVLNGDGGNGRVESSETATTFERSWTIEVSWQQGRRIREKLEKELRPVELEIEDISYQHAGHSGVRGSDGETHFNVRVVSKEFEGKSLVKRHRLIYSLLQDELQSGLHALSIVAKTPSEVDSV